MEREPRQWDWLKIWGPTVVLSLVGLVIAWQYVEPAPPTRLRFAAGPEGGMYHRLAEQYADLFDLHGVEMEVIATAGSVDNVQRLLNDEADLAFIQGGVLTGGEELPVAERAELVALADVLTEPVLLFLRGIEDRDFDLTRLEGKRVAVGAPGSGTRPVALALLEAAGVTVEAAELSNGEASAALQNGEVDAAFMVLSPTAARVDELLALPGVALADFRRAEALAGRFRFLKPAMLYEGAVNLAEDRPAADVRLIAPAAALAGRADLHSGVATLAVYAATEVHAGGDALDPPGTYPVRSVGDLPMSDAADYALRNGPNFLHRSLPFWAASLVDRLLILMLPLLGLLIPLMRIAPPTYRWRVRRKIYRWYKRLNELSVAVQRDPTPARASSLLNDARALDEEIAQVNVPLSYMDELYDLRLHVQFLERRLEAASAAESVQ